jgi:putative hydrolase of the HAD superfamily
MRHEPRAILFDLDDTLYPLRRFVRSGFRAVAAHLAATRRLDQDAVLRALDDAACQGLDGRELQFLAARFHLPPEDVPALVDVIRRHPPTIRLPRESSSTLQLLRHTWLLGVVTNGIPEIQRRKIDALGLQPLLDAVVFATEHGSGAGKPERAAFDEAVRRLDVVRARTVFVGDDEACDMRGAAEAGLHTIFIGRRPGDTAVRRSEYAEATVASIAEVPAAATRLIGGEGERYVA